MAALAKIFEQENLQRQQAAEITMAQALTVPAPDPLTDVEKALLVDFVRWCQQRCVGHCPAKPTTISTFVGEIRHREKDFVLATVEAINRLHDIHGLPNPVATHAVNFILAEIVGPIEPPRSWSKEEKLQFANLPTTICAVIARRETERKKDLRRRQNLLAEELKKIKTQETNNMAKKQQGYEKGAGPFSKDDAELTRVTIKDNKPGRDISRNVDSNQAVNNGAPGALNPGSWNK